MADRRPPLRAVGDIVVEAVEQNMIGRHLDNAIWAGADRMSAEFRRPGAFAIFRRQDRQHLRDIFQRRREHPLEVNAHMGRVNRFGPGQPGVVGWHRHRRIVQRHADGVNHIGRRHPVTVLEHRVGPQLEFQRGIVDIFPRRGKQRLKCKTARIAPNQPVPHLMRQDQFGALRVVIGIGIENRIAPGDAQRIGGLLRPCRRRGAGEQQASQKCRRPAHRLPHRRVEGTAVEQQILPNDETGLRAA